VLAALAWPAPLRRQLGPALGLLRLLVVHAMSPLRSATAAHAAGRGSHAGGGEGAALAGDDAHAGGSAANSIPGCTARGALCRHQPGAVRPPLSAYSPASHFPHELAIKRALCKESIQARCRCCPPPDVQPPTPWFPATPPAPRPPARPATTLQGLRDSAFYLVLWAWHLLLYLAFVAVFCTFGGLIGLRTFTANSYSLQVGGVRVLGRRVAVCVG
jgi:hypothetical protein